MSGEKKSFVQQVRDAKKLREKRVMRREPFTWSEAVVREVRPSGQDFDAVAKPVEGAVDGRKSPGTLSQASVKGSVRDARTGKVSGKK